MCWKSDKFYREQQSRRLRVREIEFDNFFKFRFKERGHLNYKFINKGNKETLLC